MCVLLLLLQNTPPTLNTRMANNLNLHLQLSAMQWILFSLADIGYSKLVLGQQCTGEGIEHSHFPFHG